MSLKHFILSFLGLSVLAFYSCQKEREDPPSEPNKSNVSKSSTCELYREVLVNNTSASSGGQEKIIEWKYKDGLRIEQRTNFPPDSLWLDSMRFTYKNGLVDSLQTFQKNNPNYVRIHVFRHDSLDRLTRIIRFDGEIRSGTENIIYSNSRTGIYSTEQDRYKFYLDSLGNIIKLKLLNQTFPWQAVYYYYIYDKSINPHYRKATYPLNVSNYLSPNYLSSVVTFQDSLFNHDSAVAARAIVSSISKNPQELPVEFHSDTSSNFYYKRIYTYDCN